MARVFQSGAETGDVTNGETTPANSIVADTAHVRTGTYAYKIGATGSSASSRGEAIATFSKTLSVGTHYYDRVWIYWDGTTIPRDTDLYWPHSTNEDANPDVIYLRTTGKLALSSSVIFVSAQESSGVLQVGWNVLEVHTIHSTSNTSADGTMEIKLNGVSEIVSTNRNNSVTAGAPLCAASGLSLWFDDWCINSATGTVNNSWVGAGGGIVNIAPGSDTATINWTVTGAGSHAAALDDFPGTADTTTYISTAVKTASFEDRWNFADTPSAIGSSDTIAAACFGVRGGGTATQTRTAKFQARDASNNTQDGTTIDWNLNGYKTVYPILTLEQTMGGSPAAMTKSYLDGLMGAAVETNTNSNEIRWTTVWASIDFTAAAVATHAPPPYLPRPQFYTRRRVI